MRSIPKKTVEQILDSGNDFLITVKKNQPKLYEHLQTKFEQGNVQSVDDQTEQVRDRITQRTVSVLAATDELDVTWLGMQSFVRVKRTGIQGTEAMHEIYISAITTDDATLSQQIRDHGQVENWFIASFAFCHKPALP